MSIVLILFLSALVIQTIIDLCHASVEAGLSVAKGHVESWPLRLIYYKGQIAMDNIRSINDIIVPAICLPLNTKFSLQHSSVKLRLVPAITYHKHRKIIIGDSAVIQVRLLIHIIVIVLSIRDPYKTNMVSEPF